MRVVKIANGQRILHAIARAMTKARQEAIATLTGIEPFFNPCARHSQMRSNASIGGVMARFLGTLFASRSIGAIIEAALLDNLARLPAGRQIIRARCRTGADQIAIRINRLAQQHGAPIAIFFRIAVTRHNLDQLHGLGAMFGFQMFVKGHTGWCVKTPARAMRNNERAEVLRFQAFNQRARCLGNLETIFRQLLNRQIRVA